MDAHTETLVGKSGKITYPKSEEFEVGNGKNDLHLKNPNMFKSVGQFFD